jgi:hypothetical protein
MGQRDAEFQTLGLPGHSCGITTFLGACHQGRHGLPALGRHSWPCPGHKELGQYQEAGPVGQGTVHPAPCAARVPARQGRSSDWGHKQFMLGSGHCCLLMSDQGQEGDPSEP